MNMFVMFSPFSGLKLTVVSHKLRMHIHTNLNMIDDDT